MIAATSALFWLFTVLIPEYCLTLMGDADAMGAPTIGYLIALISSLPVVIFLPLAILYWLQYLGRILVSSAMGETIPPRTPDRNFNGFFSGISPWLIWLAMGVSVGMLPLVFYITSRNSAADLNPLVAVGLLALGIPYISMALMLAFLHDHPMAANPWNIAVAMFRLKGSSILLSLFVVLALAFIAGAFAVARFLRPNHYRIYLHLATGELGGHAVDVDRRDACSGHILLSPSDNTAMASREPAACWGVAWRAAELTAAAWLATPRRALSRSCPSVA